MLSTIFAAAFLSLALISFLIRRKFRNVSLVLALCAAFLFGAWRAQSAAAHALDLPAGAGRDAPLLCEGSVDGPLRLKEWGASFDLELSACGANEGALSSAGGSVRVNARHVPEGLADGDRVRALIAIKAPRKFDNPGAFDYARYLMSLGVGAVANARGPVMHIDQDGEALRGAVGRARKRVASAIDEAAGQPEDAILRALAIGDRSFVTQDLRDWFARSGLAHLLALSGLHVGYVALLIYLLVRASIGLVPPLVSRVPVRIMAAGLTIPAVWFYVIFTGCSISAIRAAVMLSVFLAGVMLMRRPDAFCTIAAAVIAIVAILPESTLSVSFQLSIFAVLGIATIAVPMMRWIRGSGEAPGVRRRILYWITATATVSFAATLATAPAVGYHFKMFTAVGIFANMIAVPLTGFLLQPLVLVATAVAALSPDSAAWLWSAAGSVAAVLVKSASFASSAGEPLIGRWAPSIAEVAMAYAALACVAAWKRLPYKKIMVSSLMIAMFTDVIYYRALPAFDQRLRVIYFDVGQGDSALVRFPGGENLLIDAGGIKGSSIDVGKEVLAPALLAMGVRRIDRVLLTHPHYDHYAGIVSLLKDFGPRLLWTNGLAAPEKEAGDWDVLVAAARAAGVPMVAVGEHGLREEIEGATLEISLPKDLAAEDINDTSLIVRISLRARSFLFTGDLTKEGETSLISSGIDLDSDVLKVGHHGSNDASSEEFLRAVSPEIAVISAGVGNPYGFPHKDALARIERTGARVFRTDWHGAISLTTDGDSLDVSCYSDEASAAPAD
ncbi:MAG: DNA internalization-related competence protein ComEC/Rec2 [bacterium]